MLSHPTAVVLTRLLIHMSPQSLNLASISVRFIDDTFNYYASLRKKGFLYVQTFDSSTTLLGNTSKTSSYSDYSRKKLLWISLVSTGTNIAQQFANCREEDNNEVFRQLLYYIMMVVCIEDADKHNSNDVHMLEVAIQNKLADVMMCPRQIFRLFHRRNQCNCLQDTYYRYKGKTKRIETSSACDKTVEISSLYKCSRCNVSNYFSYDCALSHQSHKPE